MNCLVPFIQHCFQEMFILNCRRSFHHHPSVFSMFTGVTSVSRDTDLVEPGVWQWHWLPSKPINTVDKVRLRWDLAHKFSFEKAQQSLSQKQWEKCLDPGSDDKDELFPPCYVNGEGLDRSSQHSIRQSLSCQFIPLLSIVISLVWQIREQIIVGTNDI